MAANPGWKFIGWELDSRNLSGNRITDFTDF